MVRKSASNRLAGYRGTTARPSKRPTPADQPARHFELRAIFAVFAAPHAYRSNTIEPFVVVVNGERIYRGAFVLSVCSRSVALPSITLWGYVQIPGPNLPTNSFFIERTYAAPFLKTGPDPRSDNRIRRALEMLHKLK